MSDSIYSIVSRAGLSSSPSYYSGYAANTGDLRQERLTAIHQDIKRFHGDDAAKGFVDMMKHISNLAPTYFLNELYRLAGNDFKYQKPKHEIPEGQKNIEVSDLGSAFGTVMMKMGPAQHDATDEIRANFLWSVGEPCRMPEYMQFQIEAVRRRHMYEARRRGYDWPDDDY